MNNNPIIQLKARAKINLRLAVEGRRPDGYHLLSMLNATLKLCDIISMRVFSEGAVVIASIDGPFTSEKELLLDPNKNLAGKAALAFKEKFDVPIGLEVSIEKNIPSGAGLGGGSSDAASILKFLGAHFESQIGANNKKAYWGSIGEIATNLGADVPFFLSNGFGYVSGIGEEVSELKTSLVNKLPCLLVYPNQHSDTKTIFSKMRKTSPDLEFQLDLEVKKANETQFSREDLLKLVRNDLEPYVSEEFPVVKRLLLELRKESHLVAGLTGSGTAVFAIPKSEGAETTLEALCHKYKSQGLSAWTTEFETNG